MKESHVQLCRPWQFNPQSWAPLMGSACAQRGCIQASSGQECRFGVPHLSECMAFGGDLQAEAVLMSIKQWLVRGVVLFCFHACAASDGLFASLHPSPEDGGSLVSSLEQCSKCGIQAGEHFTVSDERSACLWPTYRIRNRPLCRPFSFLQYTYSQMISQ